jgi:hypothetical protein
LSESWCTAVISEHAVVWVMVHSSDIWTWGFISHDVSGGYSSDIWTWGFISRGVEQWYLNMRFYQPWCQRRIQQWYLSRRLYEPWCQWRVQQWRSMLMHVQQCRSSRCHTSHAVSHKQQSNETSTVIPSGICGSSRFLSWHLASKFVFTCAECDKLGLRSIRRVFFFEIVVVSQYFKPWLTASLISSKIPI